MPEFPCKDGRTETELRFRAHHPATNQVPSQFTETVPNVESTSLRCSCFYSQCSVPTKSRLFRPLKCRVRRHFTLLSLFHWEGRLQTSDSSLFFFFLFTGRYIVLDKVPGLEVTESGLESRCRMGQFNKFCRAQNCQYFD